jgi:hypothetical protein
MNTKIAPNSQIPAIDTDHLIRLITEHIRKGEEAEERAEKAQTKAADHYIAAGQYLTQLKAGTGSWAEWEQLLKDKIGIGKSWAGELMALGEGRKSIEQLRAEATERQRVLRDRTDVTERIASPPLPQQDRRPGSIQLSKRSVQRLSSLGDKLAENWREGVKALSSPTAVPEPKATDDADYSRLIDALARSTPETRRSAFMSLASGRHQNDLPAVMEALSDLYTLLARVGRQ